ncbi:MAG TPA: uroporphyrinogen-III synthase, partial [Phycisphaerae bacterium]
ALADALKPFGLRGQRCLMLRSNLARSALREGLVAAGAECDDIAIYRTGRPANLPAHARQMLLAGQIDWATFTSSSTFVNLIALLGPDAERALGAVRIASIGPITSKAIRAAGWQPTVEAAVYTADGLIDAILNTSGRSNL